MLWKCRRCQSTDISVRKLSVEYQGSTERSRGIVRCRSCGRTYSVRRSVHAVDLISGASGAPVVGSATAAGE